MSSHRHPRARVSKKVHSDNVSPADALESLHTEVAQLEVFAHAASEVITRLSPPADRGERREFIRLYALVNRVAADAIAAAEHGDELIAALSAHQEAD